MSKIKTSFFGQNCGTQYSKWQGQCNACREWNTIAEEVIQKEEKTVWKNPTQKTRISAPLKVGDIDSSLEIRMDTCDAELNRVLGGGIVPGSRCALNELLQMAIIAIFLRKQRRKISSNKSKI